LDRSESGFKADLELGLVGTGILEGEAWDEVVDFFGVAGAVCALLLEEELELDDAGLVSRENMLSAVYCL
jgi:hypothetical protein